MNKKFFTDIKIIKKAISDKKLVIFSGAGVSIDAGIPSWAELIEKLQKEINIPTWETDSLRIAQMHYNERGSKEHFDRVRHVLKHKKVRYNEIHEAIFELSPEHILTTNYDDLLEQVIKAKAYPFTVVKQDNDFPYVKGSNLLVKLHGDLDILNIVLKEEDYINFSENFPLIEAFLKSLFASKIILFVGYSFSDIDLKMIIQRVRNILGVNFQNSYLLNTDSNFHPTQREYLKSKGVNVINYHDAVENEKNYIEEYLKGSNAFKESYILESNKLSHKGQELLNFLRFINYYDAFVEPLSRLNIVQQAHFSLERFVEFNTIPPDFLANLFPFNISKDYVHHYYSNGDLLTHNEDLANIFYNLLEYDEHGFIKTENDEIVFDNSKITDIELSKNKYKQLLPSIINKLNNSFIFRIYKKGASPDSFGNYGRANQGKYLGTSNLFDDGYKKTLMYKYDQFQFTELINTLDNLSVNDTSDLKIDMELAYFNHKIGNFYVSYTQFEEIANKAWQTSKYITYFIAKTNVKNLRNFILYESKLDSDLKKQIKRIVDKLNLNNILDNLPDVDEEQYKLLTKIENDYIFIDLKDEISVNHFEVVENFERYKNGGRLLGESKAHKMLRNVSELVSFYTRNYIIFDEFSKFKNVVATALEGLFISFATDKKYTGRFEHFDEFTIDLWLQYGNAKKILETLSNYKINNLNIEPKSLEYLIQIGHNFLSMNHTESKFWSNVRESDDFNKMVLNQFFSDKFRERFNNLFLLLSLIKFDKSEQIISVIDKLIIFLQYPNELYWSNIDYLNRFIIKNEHLFTKEHIEKMLSIASDKNQFNEETYELISKIAITNNLNINFSNKFFIDGLLNIKRETISKYDTLISIWKIADFDLKTYISSTIEECLSKHFSFHLFINAVNNKVLHIDTFFDKCINHFNNMPLGGEDEEDIFGIKNVNFEFRDFIRFLLDNEIDFKDERLTNLKELGDFEQFGLNPNQFDYSKFKLEWLRYYGFKNFMEKIKNNQFIKVIIEEHLKSNSDENMSRLYFNWFIN